MTEYLCLTVVGQPGEEEAAFKARLTAFWSYLLRNRPVDYQRVYAEATRFTTSGGRVARQYMVEAEAIDAITAALAEHGLGYDPVDREDTYSKYEATSPDWYQIEH